MSDPKLYNVNLETGECIAAYKVDWESRPLEEVITDLRFAAQGLENPTIDIDTHENYDLVDCSIMVSGKRQLTALERAEFIAERDKQIRFREHMARFKG